MMDWIASLPIGWAILLFWSLAIIRSTTTYSLARGIAAGAEHTALRRYLSGPVYLQAMRFVDRWGPWAIPLCFMTVGIQTAVIAAAGLTRMRWRRFLPAMLLGSLVWGIIYGTVGMAVVWAIITAALASPWAAVALVLALAGVVLLVVWGTGGPARLRAARSQRRARTAAQRPGTQPDTNSDAGR